RQAIARGGDARTVSLRTRVRARIDQFDSCGADTGFARRFGNDVGCAEQNRPGDFPINETARGGEHANVIAFRQNDLEMTTAYCIETAFDGIHVKFAKEWGRGID